MLDTAPILWLQSWSTPGLTASMNLISLLGYSHSCLAVAALVAFGWKVRAGVALFVIVALTAVLGSLAKATWASPRPDSVDPRVQHLSLFYLRPAPDAAPRTDVEDRFGFPSGHVAATTALVVGLAMLVGRRWLWSFASVSIALMALSRMYLGRHFLADVLGGLVLGLLSLAVGWRVLRLRTLAPPAAAETRRVSQGLLAVAVIVMAAPFLTGLPAAFDAGRLAGSSAAAALLIKYEQLEDMRSGRDRLAASVLSIVLLSAAVAWDVAPHLVGGGVVAARAARVLGAALLAGAALLVPVVAVRLTRS